MQEEPRDLDPARIILFENDEVGGRLGRYIKKLEIHGCFAFTQPESDESDEEEGDEQVDLGTLIARQLRSFEFVVEACRKMLKLCTRLEQLKFVDFHPIALRTILETAVGSMASSLKSFRWMQPSLHSESYPVDLSPAQFVKQLALFVKLQVLEIDISLHSKRKLFGSERPPLPTASLPLVSLTHDLATIFGCESDEEDESLGEDEEIVTLLLRSTSKETLRKVELRSAHPFDAISKQLRQPGFHLNSLTLTYYYAAPEIMLDAVTSILPFHRHLSILHIGAFVSGDPVKIPRSFLDALPREIVSLMVGVVIDEDKEWVEEILELLPTTLDSFAVKRRNEDGDDVTYEWEELIV